jgi:hypothetical protein
VVEATAEDEVHIRLEVDTVGGIGEDVVEDIRHTSRGSRHRFWEFREV